MKTGSQILMSSRYHLSIQSLFMCIGKHAELLFQSLGAISKSRIAKTDFKKSPAIYFKWEPTL